MTASEFASDFNKWKKALFLSVKLALKTQLVFTCSKSGTETLEQVVKYVQSHYCQIRTDFTLCSDAFIVDFEQVNAFWVGWIVERNVFQSENQVMLKNGS